MSTKQPGSTDNTGRLRRVGSFAEIEEEFIQRISTMVYCSAATIDSHQHTRSRVLHPIWEGRNGWVTTEAKAAKVKQLAANPFISIKGNASMRSNEERVWPVQAFHSRFAFQCVYLVFRPAGRKTRYKKR
jgi:hypothetical protein